MVQGPPGAQGPTGPRGFKGRKVSRNESKLMTAVLLIWIHLYENKLHIFIRVQWRSSVKMNMLSLINHNSCNPCRALQGLRDLTESPVCQEIQENQDPQATLPTLGWVNWSLCSFMIESVKVKPLLCNCLKMSFESFQGNLVSQMTSGFNEKSSFAGMVSGSRVSTTFNFLFYLYEKLESLLLCTV